MQGAFEIARRGLPNTATRYVVRIAFGGDDDSFGEMKRREELFFERAVGRIGVNDFDLDDTFMPRVLEEARHLGTRGFERARDLFLRAIVLIVQPRGAEHELLVIARRHLAFLLEQM